MNTVFFRCTEQGWTWENLSSQPDRLLYRSRHKVLSAARRFLGIRDLDFRVIGCGRYTN